MVSSLHEKVLIFLIMFIPVVALSQKTVKLKKKYFGTYKGTIPAYKMDAGDQLVEVSESAILIEIGKEDVTIAIGKNILHGTYKVLFMAKTYYLLDVNVDNQLASERILHTSVVNVCPETECFHSQWQS